MKTITSVISLGRLALLLLAGTLLVQSVTGAHWGRWNRSATIVDQLERDGRFNTLLTALELTDLRDILDGDGSFTLIAPTDDAFATLPEGTVEALVADPEALKPILLYHVVGGRQYSYHLFQGSTATTLEGNPLLVTLEQRRLDVNGIPITKANVRASNGVIHIIDSGVLLPPEESIVIESVVDVLKLDGRFSTLLAAVEVAGLGEALTTTPDLTLFAPTDEAFAAIPEETLQGLLADKEALTEVLLYHVVGERQGVIELVRKGGATTLQGQSVEVNYEKRKFFVNESQVINPNVRAPNGYILTLDAVLLPEEDDETGTDLVDLLEQDGRFTTLLTAVKLAGLEETLRSEGPFTVLAPTDKAFARLPEETLQALLDDVDALTNVLLYHVLGENKSLSELRHERRATTVQGSNVHVRPWFRWTLINKSWVIGSDLEASNGVAHVLNAVLIPPSED